MDRIDELLKIPRGNGTPDNNSIRGLLDLLEVTRPRSVLEIGCDRGVSTECFLLHAQRVVAVDPWTGGGYQGDAYDAFMRRCGPYPNLEVVRGSSPEVLSQFADGEFDLVYIDAEHDYASVAADIQGAKRLANRWMSGHDCWHAFPGVERAVRELLGEPRVFSDTSWLCENSWNPKKPTVS